MARCMIHEKDLLKEYQAEVTNTVVFLLNRLPTKAVNGMTPFKAWYGFKPNLKNMKIFGCLCFTHMPQIKRDKLNKKSEPSVFIGYNNTSNAYRVFQPQSGKILINRDVFFIEAEKWDWNLENKISPIHMQPSEDDVDNQPVRGTRPLADIYVRCNVAIMEPIGVEEAMQNRKWLLAMQEELCMIEKNHTWQLVPRPSNRKVIGVKWIFRTKLNANGSINKHKARLVVKGYAQAFDVDFSKTFGLVARLDTIRLLLAMIAQNGQKVV